MARTLEQIEGEQEIYRLARELGATLGKPATQAAIIALRERLAQEQARIRPPALQEKILQIGRECAALPVLDPRTSDAILGYDERGMLAS